MHGENLGLLAFAVASFTLVGMAGGVILLVLANQRRVFAHKMEKLKLLEEEAKIREELLQAATVGRTIPWSWNPSSGVFRLGQGAVNLFGEEAVETTVRDMKGLLSLVLEEDRKLCETLMEGALDEGTPLTLKVRMKGSAEDPVLWVRWNAGLVGERMLGTLRDITREVRLQEQLSRSQRLEGVALMAAGLTHELKNILMVLRGNAELMQMDESLDERQLRRIKVIEEASDRGRDLLQKLLGLSRERTPSMTDQDMHPILEEIAALLKPSLGSHIRFHLEMAPDPIRIRCDKGQIHQVLLNLGLNAKDAMPEGGTLRLSSGVNSKAAAGQAWIEIADTGTGMTPEVQARIFDPFYTTKGEGKGTGLGLAVSASIVEEHGGYLECESEVGKGTCFRILLPVVD